MLETFFGYSFSILSLSKFLPGSLSPLGPLLAYANMLRNGVRAIRKSLTTPRITPINDRKYKGRYGSGPERGESDPLVQSSC